MARYKYDPRQKKVIPVEEYDELYGNEPQESGIQIHWVGGSPDQKRRQKDWIKKNPGGTTLPEYQKQINANTEKAREAKAKAFRR